MSPTTLLAGPEYENEIDKLWKLESNVMWCDMLLVA